MRAQGALAITLAVGLSLTACTQQKGEANSIGGIARAGAPTAVAQAMPGADRPASKSARFAALPDRGELLHYDAQAPVRDGAYTWHRTELSEQHALDAIKGGGLRVVTPSGQLLGFQYDRSVRHDESGDWTWIGHLPGQEGVQAILTFGKDAVYGSIGQPDSRPLRLTMQGGASWLVETNPTLLAGLASHAANPISPDYRIVSPAALKRLRELQPVAGAMQASEPTPTAVSATITATPAVDLVIGYTQGFVAAKGSTSAVVTRLNSMVDTANVGLHNSQVNGQIRLVHTMQVNYTDTNTNDAALGQLTGYDSDAQKETTPNAAFNALRAARETYKADLVSLVRPFKEPEQDSCGIAWLVGGGKQGDTVTATSGWDYFGYSVVSDGTDRNETDGKTYFCEEHTLAHELGHNMGSNHDRDNSKGDDNVLDDPDDYGAFAYSFGYKPTAFYTIMAYGDKGQTSYLTFSNPRITFCGGVVCGVANSEDNAQSLGKLLPKVAQFRQEIVQEPDPDEAPVRNVAAGNFNGDGKFDIFWRNTVAGQNVIWRSASSGTQTAVTRVTDLAWHVVGVGDFNEDGRSDLVWRNGENGKGAIWLSGSSSTQQSLTAVSDPSWDVVGTGDFNGDGRSDLVWRNYGTGGNAIWLSGNFRTQQAMASVTDPRWQIVGVEDFNGDGKSDVLWRHSSSGRNVIWLSGNGATQLSVATLADTDWKVAGCGDFNGDGRGDVLWRNSGDGGNVIWLSGNSQTRRSVTGITDLKWQVASVGDFNGDGRSDILWRHASTGRNVIWRSAYSTAQQAVTQVSNLSWIVAG